MDLIDSLSHHIDTLSTDFLLADPESSTDIDHLGRLFSSMDQVPWKTDFPELTRFSLKGIDLLTQIKAEPTEIRPRLFEALGALICDIQESVRQRNRLDLPVSKGFPEKENPDASHGESPDNSLQPHGPGLKASFNRLRHPGKLPDYLDNEVFVEFLTLQPEVIQKMEALILSLEQSFSKPHMAELKRLIHTVKGEAGFLNLIDVETLLHQTEAFLDQRYDRESSDALLSTVDWLKKACEFYSGKGVRLIPVEEALGRLKKKTVTDPRMPQIEEPSDDADPGRTEALVEESVLPVHGDGVSGSLRETIAVDAERLDRMVNMIGELVIVESILSQADEIRKINSPRLFKTIGAMTKITRELQAMGLSLRMIPIRSVFQKMGRIARDVAKKAGKPIRFVMSGEETELDKTIVDKLNDPLMHLIRNAIDHGIEESAEERHRKGKPGVAIIALRAFHQGGNVHVEVQDDGKGLDPEKILSKAIDMNLVSKSDALNEPDIFKLIFEPGFSTASEVTEISGRGVGMNVVRERIESLRGSVHIETKISQGTTFSLVIPLTLAIIEGLIVRAGKTRFIIPALSVRTTLCIDGKTIHTLLGKEEMILFMGKMVPLFRLTALMGEASPPAGDERNFVVIVEAADRESAILVDELIGKQQIVIKSLGALTQKTPFVSGGAILHDGEVGLILDVPGLVKIAGKKAANIAE